jgi:hypothetical protein
MEVVCDVGSRDNFTARQVVPVLRAVDLFARYGNTVIRC